MTELYENIRQEVKDTAEAAWKVAIIQHTPVQAADFLNTITEYYRSIWLEEEVEFLQFYFQMKMMEMMKDD